jgi:outer membrane protein assembly factor BamB
VWSHILSANSVTSFVTYQNLNLLKLNNDMEQNKKEKKNTKSKNLVDDKMKISGKQKTTAIALILMLTVATVMISLPGVNAIQVTTANLSVAYNPIGVGQTQLVNGWVAPAPLTAGAIAKEVYHGVKVNIVKPDGTNYTWGPYDTEQSGTFYFYYVVPDQVGVYQVQLFYPGGLNYTASTSPVTEFTAQAEPVQIGYPDTPLPGPNYYWTAPVSAENRLWASISGPWLQQRYDTHGSDFNPYTTAPNTAHILWTQQNSIGGIVGGDLGTIGLSGTGSGNPIVTSGKVYFSLGDGLHCVDLYTGETQWVVPGARADAAQLMIPVPTTLEFQSQAVRTYLWNFAGQTTGSAQTPSVRAYIQYDAATGAVTEVVPNALLSPSTFSGICGWDAYQGIAYIVQRSSPTATERNPAGFLIKWNSSAPGVTTDWKNGIVWNVSAPEGTGNNPVVDPTVPNVVTLLNYHTVNIGYDTTTGNILWQYPIDYYGYTAIGAGDGKAFIHEDATRKTRAYDLRTGELVWESQPTVYPWGAFMSYTPGVAYGNYYGLYYNGVYAFNTTTGEISWRFYAGNTTETPYGTWPFYLGPVIADGKVYAGNSEHTPTFPRYRGNRFYAINASTGEEVWSILGALAPRAVAYGYLIADNEYDGITYCFGKGQTAATLSASPEVSVHGDTVLIKGTVTDQSPGAKGTPAISDDSMSAWMEYLYMQQPCPANATGVEISLDTIDPNNNYVHIDTVTSDSYGAFSYMWTPEVPGKYRVIATFAGSESYWSSYAETAIGVNDAPPPTAALEYPQPIDNTMTILYATIAIIIAIAIVGILLLRKK